MQRESTHAEGVPRLGGGGGGGGMGEELESQATLLRAQVREVATSVLAATRATLKQPAADTKQDPRELLRPVATLMGQAHAKIKLESASHVSLVMATVIIYVSLFTCLLSAIAVAVLSNLSNQLTLDLDSAQALFALEGVCRTLAVAIMVFLLLTYPVRIVVNATMQRQSVILVEQMLLIVLIVLVNCTPGLSIFSPIIFWQQYVETIAFVSNVNVTSAAASSTTFANNQTSQGSLFVMYFFARSPSANTAVLVTEAFTIIIMSFLAWYFGIMTGFLGSVQPQPDNQATTTTSGQNKRKRKLKWYEVFLKTLVFTLVQSNFKWFLVCGAYLVIFIPLCVKFDFLPSQVPFVGLITVLRTCPLPANSSSVFAAVNPNITTSSSISQCDPSFQGGVPFARAMTISAQFVFEVIFVYGLHRILRTSSENLKKIPYETARDKHLGFRFFQANKRVSLFFIVIMSIILVSCARNTLSSNVIYKATPDSLNAVYSPLATVGINFFSLGFGSAYLAAACFVLVLANAYLPPDSYGGLRGFFCGGRDVTAVERDLRHPAYILREADVLLLRMKRDEARRRVENITRELRRERRSSLKMRSSIKLILEREKTMSDVKGNDVEQGGMGAAAGLSPPQRNNDQEEGEAGHRTHEEAQDEVDELTQTLHTAQREYDQYCAMLFPIRLTSERAGNEGDHNNDNNNNNDDSEMDPIVEQVNANLFCLETEVLLLNFAFIAYNLGSYVDENPLSTEAKQALVDHTRFQFVAHLENVAEEIQCCVFRDTQSPRIYVAFRGTSTTKNVWQDIDYFSMVEPRAATVEPLAYPTNAFAARQAVKRPLVHRGFYLAYMSVRDAVMGVVSDLVRSTPNSVVFACGHSLGGALATHFALDLGVEFPVRSSNLAGLQCTTFGSPRVGNFSYVSRHARVVPTTHRFCVGGDPVPKLPPAESLGEITKRGFHHVGVEILLDVQASNLLIAPLFVERQIQHGWHGYVPRNHVTASYILALAFWSARVHASSEYHPDWWLAVINFVSKSERVRVRKVLELKPSLAQGYYEQMNKDGAIVYDEYDRELMNRGCDTSSTSTALASKGKRVVFAGENLPELLAQCGVLYRRSERAEALMRGGIDTRGKLARASTSPEVLKACLGEDLYDDEFAALVAGGMASEDYDNEVSVPPSHPSAVECGACGHVVVEACPRCGGSDFAVVHV